MADRPVTVAVEGLAMVAPHPPSVPALTWSWSGGVDGTWSVGVAGGGLTVVEPRSATPWGGVQVMVTVVGVPLPTKVATASMFPGLKSTGPDPGPDCQVTGV